MSRFQKPKMASRAASRSIPILWPELANLPHREGEVFRRPDGKPYERPRGADDENKSAGSKIGTAFQGAVKRAGIENFRVHDCRHTWATWHYREHRNLIDCKSLAAGRRPPWLCAMRTPTLRTTGRASTPCRRLVQNPCSQNAKEQKAS